MYTIPQKSVGVGIVLSFLWVGVGHLYAGLIGKGLGLMILYLVLLALAPFTIFITGVIAFILWIWGMFNTRKTINEYNDYTRNTGQPPW